MVQSKANKTQHSGNPTPRNITDLYTQLKKYEELAKEGEFEASAIYKNDPLESLLSEGKFTSLYQVFTEICKIYPDSKLMRYFDNWITYSTVLTLIDQFSSNLELLEIPQGSVVGLMLPNSPEFIISLLACHKLGLPVVLINTTYKSTEIYHVLSRTKARVLIGLNHYYKKEISRIPTLKYIKYKIAVNLGDFLLDRYSIKKSKYVRAVCTFFKNPLNDDIPTDTLSFHELIHRKKPHYDELKTPIKSHNQHPAIIIESYNNNGIERLSLFTHEAILAQLLQLRHYFYTLENFQNVTNFNKPQIGFISILPFCSSYGVISQVYLPFILGSYSIIFSETPKTKDFMDRIFAIKPNESENGFLFFGFEIIFKRIYQFLKESRVKRKFLRRIALCINCKYPSSFEFQMQFEKETKIPLLNSFGTLEIPFISIQDEKYTHSFEKYNYNTGSPLFLTNIRERSKNRNEIRGPQQSCHQLNNLNTTHSLRNKKYPFTRRWIQNNDPVTFIENSPEKSRINLNLIPSYPHMINNNGFYVLADHLKHLYSHFPFNEDMEILDVSVSNISDMRMENVEIKEDHKDKDDKLSIHVKIQVPDRDFFPRKEFMLWTKETITWFRCPHKVELYELQKKITKDFNFDTNPELLNEKVIDLVTPEENMNLHYYEDMDLSQYTESELQVEEYLTILRRANRSESMDYSFALKELLRCLSIIKLDPEQFIRNYPTRTNDRRILERRIKFMEIQIEKASGKPIFIKGRSIGASIDTKRDMVEGESYEVSYDPELKKRK